MILLRRAHAAVTKLLKPQGSGGVSYRNSRFLTEEARDRVRVLKPGDQLHGYTVQRVEEIPEFFITAALLKHDKTGAEHLHAARDDNNNAFSVTFRTTPMDSTGVPHILEHTVLCGSATFPVRDPFFKMLSRSMATFMNALTAYDWTMYPFSSQNEQDFRNLMSVYMDAAFFPLLREIDFSQEGWRLENTDPNDPASPIIFKGVVYNEMKGVFSSAENAYSQKALNALLPSHTYGVVSGGDPAAIPSLTHQQLKEFHATHYHPSNAKFFTYGNFPLENHLEFINTTLDKFQKIPIHLDVPKEPRWDTPRVEEMVCPPDPMAADPDKQTTVSVSFLLSDITDIYEAFVSNIVCYLLVTGETAPFYRALLETNIGSDYAPTTGYHANTREALFSIGLSNIKSEDMDHVVQIINNTIDAVIKDGFDKTNIDALLHLLELSQKHETSNFGFHLAISLATPWNHGCDPIELQHLNKTIERFKKDLQANPKLLQNKLKELLKDNTHRLTLVMRPDSKFAEKRDKEEQQRLDNMVSKLTAQDKKVIHERGLELQDKQNTQEDLSCLPSLKVSDLSRAIKPEPIEMTQVDWTILQTCEQPTNGVTYLRMASNLEELSEDLMPYVPLFCQVVTSMGAGEHDYLWMSQQQDLYTGGMNASPVIVPHHTNARNVQRAILFSSYCLERNFNKMLDLWTLIFNGPNLSDMTRLSTLIQMSASSLASSLSDSGHKYAMSSSASLLNIGSWFQEMFFGYSQVRTMKQVAEMSDLSDVIFKLQAIADVVLDKSSLRLSLNATPSAMDRSVQGLKNFLSHVRGESEARPIFPELQEIEATSHQTQFELPFTVNYVARSFPGVRYTNKDFAPLNVLATLMSRKFLHREIREKGGAYGSGADSSTGNFTFFSYRDPNCVETTEVFNRCVDWASAGSFSKADVDEAKLSVFQKIDKPVAPGSRGQVRFIYDISDDMRQKNRDRLFNVSGDDLTRVSKQYLNLSSKPCGTAFLGPANSQIKEEDGWNIVTESTGEDAGKAPSQ